VYRDLYLQRARALFATTLPRSEYAGSKAMRRAVDQASYESRSAVVSGDWARVRELAVRLDGLTRSLEARAEALALAADVYEPEAVALDPLARGFERVGCRRHDVESLLNGLRAAFAELERLDPDWKERYAARRRYFEEYGASETEVTQDPGRMDAERMDAERMEVEALRALEGGHVERLRDLAEKMLAQTRAGAPPTRDWHRPAGGELGRPIPGEAVARSRTLGLAYAELPALPEVAEYIGRNAWHPGFADRQQTENGATRVLAAPDGPDLQGVPEHLRELVELFTMHPYVNSGGERYLPRFRAQPLLFEDFPEDAEPSSSPLLTALGLERRRALSRVGIEAALLEHGSTVVADRLGLDPWHYRLLCIPFDVYARVGGERGWGRRLLWTHFDGYQLMQNGHFRALVGGDVRYGGLNDLVSISPDDEREKVTARFAVVRRERLLGRGR
jgi:hypothetical protein